MTLKRKVLTILGKIFETAIGGQSPTLHTLLVVHKWISCAVQSTQFYQPSLQNTVCSATLSTTRHIFSTVLMFLLIFTSTFASDSPSFLLAESNFFLYPHSRRMVEFFFSGKGNGNQRSRMMRNRSMFYHVYELYACIYSRANTRIKHTLAHRTSRKTQSTPV